VSASSDVRGCRPIQDGWRLVVGPGSDVREGIYPYTEADATVMALSNGYLGVRGVGSAMRTLGHGTFVNGFHETFEIQHAEQAHALASCGQVIQGVPDVSTFAIRIGDQALTLDSPRLLSTHQELDFREGVVSLHAVWQLPTSGRVEVVQRRMVSLQDPHLAVFSCQVTLYGTAADVEIERLLMDQAPASERPEPHGDPRRSDQPIHGGLSPESVDRGDTVEVRTYRCRNSREAVAVGMAGLIECPGSPVPVVCAGRVRARVQPGEAVTATTLVAYHTIESPPVGIIDHGLVTEAGRHASDSLGARCRSTIATAVASGLPELRRGQRRWLDSFWDRSDVVVDAGPDSDRIQQAIRWSLFQLAQATAQAGGQGVPAKGLTGAGYSGHYFWDTEIYVLPFLAYTNPDAARRLLEFRHSMLPAARRRAAELDVAGALFPWRTINGEEASAYYPAGTAQFHIDADIAFAVRQYSVLTGDSDFADGKGLDILVETARMWVSLGFWQRDGDGRFHIHGVTGPDEYTAVVDDNYFTNTMARFNLEQAASCLAGLASRDPARYAAAVHRLGILPDEPEEWARAAGSMFLPFDQRLGIHPQDAHFLSRERWDVRGIPPERRPLLLHYHSLVIYRRQVLKQADVILAHLLRGGDLSVAQKRADFEYYEPLTTGDSTLSAFVQGVAAAEVGSQDLALRHFHDALRLDLDDRHRNTSDGVHLAAAGGLWMLLVAGFGGLRDYGEQVRIDPRLPAAWRSLDYRIMVQGAPLRVRVTHDGVTVEALGGQPVVPSGLGQPVLVRPDGRRGLSDGPRLLEPVGGLAPEGVS
jgi:alpha,alpha-trehalose phosphorylase